MKISINKLRTSLLLAALLVTSVAQPMKRKPDESEKPKSKTTLILKKKSTSQQVIEAPVNPQQPVVEQPPQTVDEITQDQIADIVNNIPIASLNTNEFYQPSYGNDFFNNNPFGILSPSLEQNYPSHNPATPINVFSPQAQT